MWRMISINQATDGSAYHYDDDALMDAMADGENFPLRIKQSKHRSDPIHKHIVSPASVCLIKMFPFAFSGNYRTA